MTTNLQLQLILFKAAKLGDFELMCALIEAGADPFAPDKKNHDAFFYANRKNPEEAAALLEELKPGKGGKNE